MSRKKPLIFLSYSWNDKEIADEIDNAFKSIGITLIRDERNVGYKESFEKYMKGIKIHPFIIMLISKSFLQSENCMKEVLLLVEDKNYKSRILPILLYDSDIHKGNASYSYLKYWENKKKNIAKEFAALSPFVKAPSIEDARQHYHKIYDSIDDFITYLRVTKTISFEELKKEAYKTILDLVGYDDVKQMWKVLFITLIRDKEEQDIELNKFFDENPSSIYGLFFRAYIAFERSEYKKAKFYYEDFLQRYSDNAEAHNNYAALLLKLNDFLGAKEHFEIALKLMPDLEGAHFNYATLLHKVNDVAGAKKLYEKELEINPNNSKAHNNLAVLLNRSLNEISTAKKHYEKALEIDPDYLDANFNYAIFLEGKLNNIQEAKKHYE